MRVIYEGKELDIPAIWLEDEKKGIVKMIDQRFLPWKLTFFESKSYRETAWAIKEMVVRGAPTIGITGAYGVFQATLESVNSGDFLKEVERKVIEIQRTRPTAVNLFNVTNAMLSIVKEKYSNGFAPREIVELLKNYAEEIARREVEANKRIGEFGEKLIEDGSKVLTHCNAGALAAVDFGTALAPIRIAHRNNKRITVYVDETRPWLQGARLTAWELEMEGIPYYIISDNAAGFLMWRKEIDLVIVGADRIARNGDVANKIGTYKLAVAAKENNIPFYVAAPLSSFDININEGREIPIEERGSEEIIYIRGYDEAKEEITKVRIAPEKARVRNPVFDITPMRYITGIITEVGILRTREDIERVLKEHFYKRLEKL